MKATQTQRKKQIRLYNETLKKIIEHRRNLQSGKAIDIHKLIGKLPHPNGGWTPPHYKYLGPYNPLEDQLTYDENGKITLWIVLPYNALDSIAAQHDVCYSVGTSKHECDKEMVSSIDKLPKCERKKTMTKLTRFLINSKQQLGLGL